MTSCAAAYCGTTQICSCFRKQTDLSPAHLITQQAAKLPQIPEAAIWGDLRPAAAPLPAIQKTSLPTARACHCLSTQPAVAHAQRQRGKVLSPLAGTFQTPAEGAGRIGRWPLPKAAPPLARLSPAAKLFCLHILGAGSAKLRQPECLEKHACHEPMRPPTAPPVALWAPAASGCCGSRMAERRLKRCRHPTAAAAPAPFRSASYFLGAGSVRLRNPEYSEK